MTIETEPVSPLRPLQFFASAWSGEGRFLPSRWLRRLRLPRRFHFRSSTTRMGDAVWLVHDETIWDDGRVERRDGLARVTAPDRIALTYDDMLGGTEIRLHARGYTLAPYLIAVPVGQLPIPLIVRCIDRCELEPDGSLLDTIDLRLAGIPLGQQVMRLRRE
jgi:hypothetical protein